MNTKNDYVTKKDLKAFEVRFEKKIDKKIDEKFDQKFGEYFDIIIKEINRVFDQKFAEQDARLQKQSDKHDYDISVLESQSNNNTHRIGMLEQKVFGAVSA